MKTRKSSAVYIGSVIALGAAILVSCIANWHVADSQRFLTFFGIALIASGMKVKLPGVTGTMSMSFVFVMIGIAQLTLAETVWMGCVGMLVQCLFFAKRAQPVQVTFNIASMACSVAAAWYVSHSVPWVVRFDVPVILPVAAAVYFVTNTCSVAAVIALTESRRVWTVWRDNYFWSFPNYLVGAAVAWIFHETARHFGWQVSLLFLPVLYVLYRSQTLYVSRLEEARQRAEDERKHSDEIAALHRRTIKTLALAVEAKDQTTSDHLARVEVYALEVGKDLGLDESQLGALRAAALLHDIGKLAVPEYIISKPGRLTPEEFERMKTHTVVGAEIVEQMRFPYDVASIVRAHHENWDGSGYPDGLAGEAIPIGARILSAVDCLDALASDRQYRRALPLDEAIQVVCKDVGRAFDPRVVEALSGRYAEIEKMARVVAQSEKSKLSTDAKIQRGAAPAAGFENARASEDLVNFHSALADAGRDALVGLSQTLEHCTDRRAALTQVRDTLRKVVPYQALALYLRRGETLAPEYVDGEDYLLFADLEIPVGVGLSGWVAENGKSILNGNPSVEPGYLNDPARFGVLRSALAVPLEFAGSVTGVLSLYRCDRDAFTKEQLRWLLSAASSLARTLEGAPARK